MVDVRDRIDCAVRENHAHRVVGVTGGLYRLSELRPFQRIPHGTVSVLRRKHDNFILARSDAEFMRRFLREDYVMAEFDYSRHGLVLAGGAVSAFVIADCRHCFDDYDLFLVGHSPVTALSAIASLGDYLHLKWGPRIKIFRTVNCITFHCTGYRRVQVILRLYSTRAEVVHGFDLGSSAFLWDGTAVFCSATGRLAAELGVNVLDLVVRRASYETRLVKYFDRGFDVVVPNLNVHRMLSGSGHELPFLYLAECHSCGLCNCCCYVKGLFTRTNGIPGSEYHLIDSTRLYHDTNVLLRQNLSAMANGEIDRLCARAAYRPGLIVHGVQPTILADAVCDLVLRSLATKKFDMGEITRLLGSDGAQIIGSLYLQGKHMDNRTLRELCAQRLQTLPVPILPFRFMVVEDHTALTGPFPRRVVSPVDWYGALYSPEIIPVIMECPIRTTRYHRK